MKDLSDQETRKQKDLRDKMTKHPVKATSLMSALGIEVHHM